MEINPTSVMSPAHVVHMPIVATDPAELSDLLRDWNFEFTQLTPGKLQANGAMVDLGGVNVARIANNQTMQQRGYAPRGMAGMFMPGAGSGPAFAYGQLVESGQCVTLAESDLSEAVTHGHGGRYVDVALGFDMNACSSQLDALNGGSLGIALGTSIVAPDPSWVDDMLGRVEWLLNAVGEHPQALNDARVRASLADRVLAAMVRFDNSPADVDSTARAARAGRRVAVRLACEFIQSRLSEPLQLSQLCRHARLKIRSLEYGFREVTGLTPVAYIRSLRLNAVRKALQQDALPHPRSISEIAMDAGFWHLSQFAVDYRRFFGETPTETRRRRLAQGYRPAPGLNLPTHASASL